MIWRAFTDEEIAKRWPAPAVPIAKAFGALCEDGSWPGWSDDCFVLFANGSMEIQVEVDDEGAIEVLEAALQYLRGDTATRVPEIDLAQ